jgi:hypothetical protein
MLCDDRLKIKVGLVVDYVILIVKHSQFVTSGKICDPRWIDLLDKIIKNYIFYEHLNSHNWDIIIFIF